MRSTLETWVSLVLPVPQGSRRYWDSRTTPRTAPVRGLSSCSTDTHTSAHEPLHKSVRHDLRWQTDKPVREGAPREHLLSENTESSYDLSTT